MTQIAHLEATSEGDGKKERKKKKGDWLPGSEQRCLLTRCAAAAGALPAAALGWLRPCLGFFSAGVPSGPSAVAVSWGSSLGGGCTGRRRGSCSMRQPALPGQAFPTRSTSQAKTRSTLLFCQVPAPESALHAHPAPGGSPPPGAEGVGVPHARPTGSTSPAPRHRLPVFTESC